MAFSTSPKHWPFSFAVFYIFVSFCQFGSCKAESVYPPNTAAAGVLANEYLPVPGGVNQHYPQTIPADHTISEALLCFNEKQIYSSCDESYRLSQKGELNVPLENTDEYCNGPCVSETNLVLNCIGSLFFNFKFYNEATINNVRETIKSGCGYGPERGDFNVAEHVQDEYSHAHKTHTNTKLLLCGLVLVIMARRLLL